MIEARIPSRPVLYFRSALFWLGFMCATIVVGIAVILAYPFDSDLRLRIARNWGVVNLWLLKIICKLDYQVSGAENIGERNAIVFAKHQSTWETIALHAIIPLGRWVFKRELMRIPLFGWALACTDPIAIDRAAGRAAVKQLVTRGTEKLKRGKWINLFPEGTRTAPGASSKYKMGGAILAVESGYPVIPVAHNAGEYWPRHSFIKWPGTIEVRIGPYIESAGRKPDEVMDEARAWIENAMQEISDPARWDR
jgi:1-acyl-sn-glycerol-3-phosphate acyltransferase